MNDIDNSALFYKKVKEFVAVVISMNQQPEVLEKLLHRCRTTHDELLKSDADDNLMNLLLSEMIIKDSYVYIHNNRLSSYIYDDVIAEFLSIFPPKELTVHQVNDIGILFQSRWINRPLSTIEISYVTTFRLLTSTVRDKDLLSQYKAA